ncbi:MAG: hypothetical protein CMK09_16235 [Ponticaulis sp.]|nr:hypothetical protein [Ponticaulis sp.]|tara:strand:- start:17575 stop:19236 length:1662 start_codon:yes stop_codon:yes gene_type:complete
MNNAGVKAEATSLLELLQPGRHYRIPTYQRSYSWQIADATALIEDMIEGLDEDRPHFLGAIVTVQTSIPDVLEIVDGQQRLTTLSLILACLRDLIGPAPEEAELQKFISDHTREGGWRLTLNHVDAPIFRSLAQKPKSTLDVEIEFAPLTDHTLLYENLIAVREHLKTLSQSDLQSLATYILNHCPIVHVEVANRDIGYKVFQVLNTRGRQPSAHDILKTELFERAKLTSEEGDHFSRAWIQYEARLGAKAFDDLLRQIRALHDRQMRGNFVTGFCNTVLEAIPARQFLETYLPRFVDAYVELNTGSIRLNRPMPAVDEHLSRLISLDHLGWRAPALQYLVFHERDADTTREFFCDLERLAFALQLVVPDRDARVRRYRRLSEEVVSDAALFAVDGALSLTQEERDKLTQRLLGRFGSVSQRRSLVIKLNSLLPGGETVRPDSDVTVEHILPRNPEPGSTWLDVWPHLAERRELCDSLGNFCLLTKRDNQSADRLDFLEKRDQIFRSKITGGQFALTRDAAAYAEWTPDVVKERTQRLVSLLIRDWKLDLPAG